MSIRLFFISFIVLVTSCDQNSGNFSKNNENQCDYYIDDFEKKINDSIRFKKNMSDSFIVYDERTNGFGPVYFFFKKSGLLSQFTFYNSDSSHILLEKYNPSTGEFDRNGSIVTEVIANSKNKGVEIILSYHLLNAKVKSIKLEVNGNLQSIKTLKNNYYTHIYKSVIYFPIEKERLSKNDIYFIAEFINCNGSIEKIREKMSFY